MKKLLFVMNPYAGMRKANRHLADILGIFNRAGYEVTTYMTAGPGDAVEFVRERAGQMDIVACCGGDGTFNEVMTGVLLSGADVPLGYIPAGSTNDFATSLKLPSNVLQAAQMIVSGKPRRYDVGKFGDRYFSYVASFGAFTKASYSTPQNIKNILGHTAYVLEGIQELSQLQNVHVRMEIDGELVEGDYLFGAISNSTSVGGILTLDPKQVDMGDGKFELMLVRAPKDLAELRECVLAVTSQKYDCASLTFRAAQRVRVFTQPQVAWTLDGEKEPGHEMVDVVNLHHAIQLIQEVPEA